MVGIALLGAGIFAREQHLPAIEAASCLELKAVYSRSEQTAVSLAREAKSKVDVYFDSPKTSSKSLDDLLARQDISAVIACVAILGQPQIIRRAIAAGKHVLSEKPVAADVETAKDLIGWYKSRSEAPIWGVAENFRFNESVMYAEDRLRDIGGQLTEFRLNYNTFVMPDNKYLNTQWRKVPDFQGGFVLDGGVHFVATLRLLLAAVGQEIKRLAAFSTLLENRLAPVDSVHAVASTQDAKNGTIAISFGTETKSGLEVEVVTTHGTVLWTPVAVKSTMKSQSGETQGETKEFAYNNAVKAEVEAFGLSIEAGAPHPRQDPLEALKDLQIVQAILESGDGGAMLKTVAA